MNKKTKTAVISLFVVGTLTALKFLFYYMSGSVAVLSEAWHSFSDIGTTVLVLISLILTSKKGTEPETNGDAPDKGGTTKAGSFSFDPELIAAYLISILLLCISVKIFYDAVTGKSVVISKPLLTGIMFIILSFGSYFLFRLQSSVATSEKSSALKADSLHSKTDMIVSLTTGFSLVLYYYGINVDRFVAGLISVFIFSFALELLVNSVLAFRSGEKNLSRTLSLNAIINIIFDPTTWLFFAETIGKKTGISFGNNRLSGHILRTTGYAFKRLPYLVLCGLIVMVLSTSFYTVKQDEGVLIKRFGKIMNPETPVSSGLHIKLPSPIEQVIRIQTKKMHTVEVGNKSNTNRALIWAIDHGDNEKFISGDNNLFLPYIVLNYTINNPYAYYSCHSDPVKVLQVLSYQSLTNVFLSNRFFDLALFKRNEWVQAVQKEIQAGLDELNTGLRLESFNLKDIHPPGKVAFDFENVIAAYQKKEEIINVAQGVMNSRIPLERGKAFHTNMLAATYVEKKIKKAEGEAQNYSLRLDGFITSKSILKKNMKLDVVDEVLTGKTKIIYDPSSGISSDLLYREAYVFRNYKGANAQPGTKKP